MFKFLALSIFTFFTQFSWAQPLVLSKTAFTNLAVNGPINTMVKHFDTIYIGGSFSKIGENRTAFAAMNYNQAVLENFPRVTHSTGDAYLASVESAASDKSGGYFIAGRFDRVGNLQRKGLARINANGSIHSFNIDGNLTSHVKTMDVFDNMLFAGLHSNRGYGGKQGGFHVISTTTSLAESDIPSVDGEVKTVEPDGDGGYFIGGLFNRVGDSVRMNIAHIQSDGTVSKWNPKANGIVKSIKRSGNNIYVLGAFRLIGGAERIQIAAIDKLSGYAKDWNPNPPSDAIYVSQIECMVLDNNFMFIGGRITIIQGLQRRTLAKIDLNTGAVTSWNAPYNFGIVTALCIINNKLFVGGQFSDNNGQSYKNLKALDKNTGVEISWNPIMPPSGIGVNALVANGNVIYVGGVFTFIGGQNRTNLAAIDTATGFATTFNPVITYPGASPIYPGLYPVKAMALAGNTLYIGGQTWATVNGQPRAGLAAVSILTSNTTGWQPVMDGMNVSALSVNSGKLLVGGSHYNLISNEETSFLLVFNKNTGQKLAWNPQVNSFVTKILVKDSTLYIGGHFTSVGGEFRAGLAAFSLPNLQLKPWAPVLYWPNGVNGYGHINSMDVKDSTLFIAGGFNSVNGLTRNNLAAIDSATGQVLPWNPSANNLVYALKIKDNNIYIGGSFNNVGGKTRNNIAAIARTTGIATNWFSDCDNTIYDLEVAGNFIYPRGQYSIIGNATRPGFAQLDAITGDATDFNPVTIGNPIVSCIPLPDKILIYGNFTSINAQPRNGLAAIQESTGKLLPWQSNPDLNTIGSIETMLIDGNHLFVAGSFSKINGQMRSNLASINLNTGSTNPFIADTDGAIKTIAIQDNQAYIGGSFNTINGQARKFAGSMDKNTGAVSSWNPKPNNLVNSIVPGGSQIYLGGLFSGVGDFPYYIYKNPVATHPTTGAPTAWNAGAITVDPSRLVGINSMVKDGQNLYIAGSFMLGTTNLGLAAFNLTTGAKTAWNPVNRTNAPNPSYGNGQINTIVLNPANKSILAGTNFFNLMGGMPAYGIAEISIASGNTIKENIYINAPEGYQNVKSLLISDSLLYAGGFFSNVDFNSRYNIAALAINTNRILMCPPIASYSLNANRISPSYQWQVNSGNGFINLANSANYSGVNSATLQLINIPSSFNNYQYRSVVQGGFSSTYTLNFSTEWLGTVSGNWENVSNWSCGVLPDAFTNVVVNKGTLILNSNASCKSITVQPLAKFTINPNYQLTITGK